MSFVLNISGPLDVLVHNNHDSLTVITNSPNSQWSNISLFFIPAKCDMNVSG